MFEFDFQRFDESISGDTSKWARALSIVPGETAETGWPFFTAKGLLPSTAYHFRVTARNSYGASPTSSISDVFVTGKIKIARQTVYRL